MAIIFELLCYLGFSLAILIYLLPLKAFQKNITTSVKKKNFLIFCTVVIFTICIINTNSINFFNAHFPNDFRSFGLKSVVVDSSSPNTDFNSNSQILNNKHDILSSSTHIDGDNSQIMLPSPFSSRLLLEGSDISNVVINNNNNNNINSFNITKNERNDNICGSMAANKIGFIITGAGNISGTDKDDYIIGSEGNDVICGLKGNDIIMALGGDDIAYAGKGDDTVYGGDGNNQIFGEDGSDNIYGGPFSDLLNGGNGDDHLIGGLGDDIMIGGPGADFFDCGDGLDTIVDFSPSQGDVVSNNCEIVNNIDQQ